MTQEEFVKWLDENIRMSIELRNQCPFQSKGYDRATDGVAIFTEVKKKYLTVLPPPTTLS
jgi:hypothetical protein